jgi:hypothetical protein
MVLQKHKSLSSSSVTPHRPIETNQQYTLPSEILEDLEESSSKELRTNTQKFTKEALQYDGGKWTKSGAANKMFIQELKNAKMGAYQSIQQRFNDGDRLRAAARGATEVLEEIKFVVERGTFYFEKFKCRILPFKKAVKAYSPSYKHLCLK